MKQLEYLIILATLIIFTGCGATPRYTEFSNKAIYYPDWDKYNECQPYNGYAQCYNKEDKNKIIKTLYPDIRASLWNMYYDHKNFTYKDLDSICKNAATAINLENNECKQKLKDTLLWHGEVVKAYQLQLIDKDEADLLMQQKAILQQTIQANTARRQRDDAEINANTRAINQQLQLQQMNFNLQGIRNGY